MGEVFKDPEARLELFELANADEHKEDITYSLKTLLATNQNPMTRQRSAIANAFYKNAANHRTLGEEDFNEEELIKFINSNDITMLAPYMVGYFKPDEIKELTVSYWTEEMELEGLAKNPNWKGETPGFKLKMNEDVNFIRFEQSESDLLKSDEVEASDDYAMVNPTIVFGNFEEENPENDSNLRKNSLDENINNRIVNLNSANCSHLTSSSIVRLTMPKFRLTKSIRSWPHPDKISLSIVLGATSGSNAISYRPFFEEKVTRDQARNGHWITTPATFIINNWQPRQLDMAFVVFNRRPYAGKQEFTASVTVKNGEVTTMQTATVGGWSRSQNYSNAVFERCGTIHDPFRNKGAGRESHNGILYGIERLRNFEFILVPEITL
jgi:hypothetical protein